MKTSEIKIGDEYWYRYRAATKTVIAKGKIVGHDDAKWAHWFFEGHPHSVSSWSVLAPGHHDAATVAANLVGEPVFAQTQ